MIAHLDYEFRSGVDITEVGSHRTSIDPRFELFIASVSTDDSDRVLLWVNPLFPAYDCPSENEEVEALLASADEIYAHNAPNEQANTWGALSQGKACPFKTEPPLTKWRCTAAMARKAGLPYSLDKLGAALRLDTQKDKEGKTLIKFFSSPDEETDRFNEPRDHPDKWRKFCAYCIQDNRAEKAAHLKLKAFELTGASLATFQFDLRMNQRGIPINLVAARNAQKIIDHEQAGVTAEFRKLTGLNPTQGKKLRPLLGLPNLQAPTVEEAIQQLYRNIDQAKKDGMWDAIFGVEAKIHVLELYQKVSYAAVKKIRTMLDCVCPDGRVRGAHMFYGAGTGRWSGKLLQPQNFKKPDPEFRPMLDQIYSAVGRGITAQGLDLIFGSPLECLANCIRNFIHLPGQEMLDGDYSGVEARIIAWEAGQEDILQEWRDYDAGIGPSPYVIMAAYIYEVLLDRVTGDQREVGKRVILGAGFQMGWRKFQSTCKIQYQLDLPTDLCKRGIKAFRKKCGKIRDYWWYLNNAATEAIKFKTESGPFSVRTIAGVPYLLFRLRSGRALAYPYPEVNLVKWQPEVEEDNLDEFGEVVIPEVKWRDEITYWGEIKPNIWGRVKIYGGKFAENETQATAADFMAHGAITAESRGMPPFMLVHDQGLALRANGKTAEDYAAALGDLPSWAKGFPMKVESHVAPYYRK